MGRTLVLLSVRAPEVHTVAKKSTEELQDEATDLGIAVNEEWSYSELLEVVKVAREEFNGPEDIEGVPVPEPEPETVINPEARPPRPKHGFDALGRYVGPR